MVPEPEYEPGPVTATGTWVLRGAGHSHLLHPSRASQPTQPAADAMDSTWVRHQQRAHRINSNSTQSTGAIYGAVHDREQGGKHEGPGLTRQPLPRARYPTSLESHDDASEDDALEIGFIPLPRGMGSRSQPPHYGDVARGGE